MAPRVKVLASGGEAPTMLNGETLYAGRSTPIGSGRQALDKSYLYRAQKLQHELDTKYGGNIKRMEAKYGFNPVFMQ